MNNVTDYKIDDNTCDNNRRPVHSSLEMDDNKNNTCDNNKNNRRPSHSILEIDGDINVNNNNKQRSFSGSIEFISVTESYINRFLDKFIHPSIVQANSMNNVLYSDNTNKLSYEDHLNGAWLLLQLRNIIFIQLFLIVIGIVVGITLVLMKNYFTASLSLIFICAFAAPSLCNIRYSNKPHVRLISNYCMIGLFIGSTVANTTHGGVGKASLSSIYIIIIAAFATCRVRDAVMYCVLCIMQYIYLYILHSVNFEFPVTTKDEPITLVTTNLYTLIMFFICLYRYVVSFQFYSELSKRLINILSQQKYEAEEAQQHMTEYISRMSHEFRSPLHVVLNLNEFAISEKEEPQQVEHYLNDAVAVIKTLCVLVNDVLTYARSQHIGIELKNDCVDMHQLINHVTNVTSVEQKSDVKLISEVSDSIKYVLCDETRILQILFNLVSNAKKFTKKGNITIRAHVLTVEELYDEYESHDNIIVKNYLSVDMKSNMKNKLLCLQVVDSGIGIAHDKLSQVLMPFVQADSTIIRRFGGTGLGLSIVKQLVRAMKGCLCVQSRINEGSIFSIFISYTHTHEPQIRSPSSLSIITKNNSVLSPTKTSISPTTNSISSGIRSSKSLDSLHILVVDDNKLNLKIATRLLERIGIKQIYTEDNVDDALELFKKQSFDVALIDLHMPNKSGYDCVKEIRQYENDTCKNWTPLIAFTADVNVEVNKKCRSYGFNSIILKPANVKDLKIFFDQILPQINSLNDFIV